MISHSHMKYCSDKKWVNAVCTWMEEEFIAINRLQSICSARIDFSQHGVLNSRRSSVQYSYPAYLNASTWILMKSLFVSADLSCSQNYKRPTKSSAAVCSPIRGKRACCAKIHNNFNLLLIVKLLTMINDCHVICSPSPEKKIFSNIAISRNPHCGALCVYLAKLVTMCTVLKS